MVGTLSNLENQKRTHVVDRTVLTVCQNIMYGFKSDRQVTYKGCGDSALFRVVSRRENPQVLGLALSIRHETRSKKVIELLNTNSLCVPHSRILYLETALANAVVENMKKFYGLYVPPFMKKGSFVFFAVDNADFQEDTPDGKGTTHGTITVVYQKTSAQGEPIAQPLCIKDANNLTVTPHHTTMIQCNKPKPLPLLSADTENFTVNTTGVQMKYQQQLFGWVIAYINCRLQGEHMPGWAGYNSLISENKLKTEIGALPLLPEVAHEW